MTQDQSTPANAQGVSEALAFISSARALRDADMWSGEAGELEIKAGTIIRTMIVAEAASQPIGPVSWPEELRRATGRYAALTAALSGAEAKAAGKLPRSAVPLSKLTWVGDPSDWMNFWRERDGKWVSFEGRMHPNGEIEYRNGKRSRHNVATHVSALASPAQPAGTASDHICQKCASNSEGGVPVECTCGDYASPVQQDSGWRSKAADDVLAERRRQIEAEGWSSDHDDAHDKGEMAAAAICYAFTAVRSPHEIRTRIWPWADEWWKPSDRRRNLVKAGALILAEIERLDRIASPNKGGA